MTAQQRSASQQGIERPGTQREPLPAPGTLPKMPDSVVNYENKSMDVLGSAAASLSARTD